MRWPFLNKAFSTGLFYGGWALCLQEVAAGELFYGFFVILFTVFYQLYQSPHKLAECVLLFLVLLVGPLSDILYNYFGLLEYYLPQHSLKWLPPLWVFLLWGLFSVNIHLFSWLKKRWWLATLLGAVGGPVSYFSAVRLGGANILLQPSLTFMAIGGMWALLLPGFIWLSDYLRKKIKV